MRTNLLVVGLLSAAAISVNGCGSNSGSRGQTYGVTRTALRRVQSCGDLEQTLKRDALQKMNRYFDAQIESFQHYSDNGGGFAGGGTAPPGEPTADSAAGAPGRSSNESGSDKASSHSETNTQVKGVDEADIVKTDGKYIYLLHGQSFRVLKAWPAAELGDASGTTIEGEPTEMYVDNSGHVVIYSNVNGQPIYDAAGIKPRSRYSDGVYYGGGGMARPAVDCAGPGCGGGYYANALTKITVLTIDGATTAVQREVYFEGSYQSSRRIDSKVRTVLGGANYGPALKYYPQYTDGTQYPKTKEAWIQAFEALRAENTALINASTVNDWLPYSMVRSGGAVTARLAACEDYYVPAEGSTEYGLTQIAAIDLADPAGQPKQAAIVGAVDTVYSSTGAMYLAARAWVPPNPSIWASGSTSSGGGTVGTAPDAPSTDVGTRNHFAPFVGTTTVTYTHVHKFDLNVDPSVPVYIASATVPGQIKDQFSLDERDGVLRMSTTEQRYTTEGTTSGVRSLTVNRVFALEPAGDQLQIIGDVGDLAPNESIYSTRFVGPKAYVVTFRRVDPLFVIDMANPRSLAVLGQLKIPGFSEYMHPLDEGHLLTIGQDVDETTNRRNGLALQIFDVTNPTQPKQLHKYVFSGTEWGYSEAQYNHKAFTYFADKKLLSFPFYAYTSTGMRSSAELFKIDIAAGIQKVGSVDHSSLFQSPQGYCGGYYMPYVRRSVFLDDVLFSISYGGVIASNTADLATVARLPLPAPTLDTYGGCVAK